MRREDEVEDSGVTSSKKFYIQFFYVIILSLKVDEKGKIYGRYSI